MINNKHNNVLTKPIFSNVPPKIDIYSTMYYFHNGITWIVVPYDILNNYNIISIDYRDIITDVQKKVNLVKCLKTGITTLIDMKITDSKLENELILMNKKDEYKITNLTKSIGNIYFNTLRHCLKTCIDAKYLIIDNIYSNNEENTLLSCIKYKNNSDELKLTAISGSYDKINNYLLKYNSEIDMTRACVFSCYSKFIRDFKIKLIKL